MFPSLWKGDPPMAPVNSGYCFKAGVLKEAVVAAIQERKMLCSFVSFQLRVKKTVECCSSRKVCVQL